jgi:hypothetical protein
LRQLSIEITREELEDDKLEEYIVSDMGAFCCNNAIPHNFDANLRPVNEDARLYWAAFKLYQRERLHPDHRDFANIKKGEHHPLWYTAFRSDFRSVCNRFQLRNNGDELFEGYDTQPLYRDLGDGKYGLNPYGKCDLKRIMLKIFFPAANALHGNRTLSALPVLPQMNAVGAHNRPQWDALIEKVFVVNVPDFLADGRHRVILEV